MLSLPYNENSLKLEPGKPYWRGWLFEVDLLVLTSVDQQLLILKILFMFVTKQATLMRRSTVLFHTLQLIFPEKETNANKA